jgi:hypothetical protein
MPSLARESRYVAGIAQLTRSIGVSAKKEELARRLWAVGCYLALQHVGKIDGPDDDQMTYFPNHGPKSTHQLHAHARPTWRRVFKILARLLP